MKLQSILNDLHAPSAPAAAPATKVASATGPSPVDAAIEGVLAEIGATKTASAKAAEASPVEALTKMAAEVAQIDREGEIKTAGLWGAAFADGFVRRLNEYGAAAEKVAAEAQPSPADLEKAAEDAYVEEYNNTVRAIHKTAAEHFLHGFAAAEKALAGQGR